MFPAAIADTFPAMENTVRLHYETHPYPHYPLLASVRRCDSYALNLSALWARFNGQLPTKSDQHILIAGCGSFAPYPFAVANPDIRITALDLSAANLRRARLHCLLHAIRNVRFHRGDLLDPAACPGAYGLIDAYGVIHHLQEPLVGLKALTDRLAEHGIIRLMVYSRYARQEEDSIRRAFAMLGIRDVASARQLLSRARPGSRLHSFVRSSFEMRSSSGMADALLHPCVKSYCIDELLELMHGAGLTPLLFAHHGALENPVEEIARLREMEARRESPGNFVVFLGRDNSGPCRPTEGTCLLLNPCLQGCVNSLWPGKTSVLPRLGHDTPLLDRGAQKFLRRFRQPVALDTLSVGEQQEAAVYTRALFLLHYRP
ncbi:MAG TPA: class I SAM-dependent methyltransferase [Deltaproteobacteria bacterium]|nr:class I SAM-dependent methyltransferase [Deltaproteobacteria bacterium]